MFGGQGQRGAAAAVAGGSAPVALLYGIQPVAGMAPMPHMAPAPLHNAPQQLPPAPQPATSPRTLAQLGEQFAPFAYPPGTSFNQRWGKEEQAYAQQIVAAFTARCPGLKDRALYTNCHNSDPSGYDVQLVQETRSAKQQLFATFERCFEARYQAVGSDSKKIANKVLQMLGHRKRRNFHYLRYRCVTQWISKPGNRIWAPATGRRRRPRVPAAAAAIFAPDHYSRDPLE